jgi:ATP-dependent Clp protease ATP-binding subunit ClpA
MFFLKFILPLAMVGFAHTANAQQSKQPNLAALNESGFVMAPGNAAYPINESWRSITQMMQFAATFDSIVQEIEAVVCSPQLNKGVLVVGEADHFYRYIFARLATRPNSPCAGMWHVEIDINKIESGHSYVGEVDQYWRDKILTPSESKNVVLYFNSLGGLIGLGSHRGDDTGIEQEYASNITSGKLRTVAFMNKYDYNETFRSKNAYVIAAFAQKVILPPVEMFQAAELVQTYLQSLYPHLKLNERELNYLLKYSNYYMPNRTEPERSMNVIEKLIREKGSSNRDTQSHAVTIETAHPYSDNTTLSWVIEYPEARELQLVFDLFDVENNYDTLTIKSAKGDVLEVLTGNKGAHRTKFYPFSKLLLEFKSDSTGPAQGFRISQVIESRYTEYTFTVNDVRTAIMTLAQVPQWLVNKDYSVIRNLRAMLDSDVVGVEEGKRDLVRLSKNGYVAGRTDDRPVGTIMLAGPTGTGKSYIAKKMAEFTGQRLITFDMTSYKEPESFETFQEVLARSLVNTPYAVYLFEEIDKASIEVLDQLYFMMDEGVFYDRYQKPLFARGAFLIFTTNAASDTILNNPKSPDLRRLVMDDLQKHFRMSFLNRFDAISIFTPFSAAEYGQLARIISNKKIASIKEFFYWTLSVDEATYDYIAVKGRSDRFGARPMERVVESVLGLGIAEYQMEYGAIDEGAVLEIAKLPEENKFSFKVEGGMGITYEVDPNNNAGLLQLLKHQSLRSLDKFFQWYRSE